MSIKTLALAASILNLTSAQTTTTIAGVGVGTFIIIIAILFSIVWCLACRSSSRPEVYSAIGLIVPVILVILFVFMPKDSELITTDTVTDVNFATHISFLVFGIVGLIVSLAFLAMDYLFTDKKAKNIARTAFVMKD
jgi:protein-S-isoprenylcysteine O-methyltransferase Ste14